LPVLGLSTPQGASAVRAVLAFCCHRTQVHRNP